MDVKNHLFGGIYRAAMRYKGIEYQHHLDQLLDSQWLSWAEIESMQFRKLRDLLGYATANVPHYRDVIGAQAPNVTTIEDLRQLPALNKQELKQKPEKIRTTEALRGLSKKTTAGSTGEPFSLWKDVAALEQEIAATWRGYSWAGIKEGDRQGRFWGVPLNTRDLWKSRAIDFVTHRKRIPAFSFDDEAMEAYTKQLLAFRPDYFYGYVSMVVAYARYVQQHFGESPFDLKGVITTSEVLTPSDRELMESAFGTRIYNEYGCAEFGTIAHECEAGSLHIAAENMIVEVMDGDRPCGEDEPGELVITELVNRAMPLIRYRTGDIGAIASSPCACGRQLPVLRGIEGRAWDMLERKDGQFFHPAFFLYIFEDAKDRNLGIEHYKVYQTAVDEFFIQLIPGSNYSRETAEAFIRGEIHRKFDADASVEFQLVDSIPREKSGKLRQVVGLRDAQKESPRAVLQRAG